MKSTAEVKDQPELTPCHTVSAEELEVLLNQHVTEVRPLIAELDRQQTRVVSTKDG